MLLNFINFILYRITFILKTKNENITVEMHQYVYDSLLLLLFFIRISFHVDELNSFLRNIINNKFEKKNILVL